jgi:hypothetical protein
MQSMHDSLQGSLHGRGLSLSQEVGAVQVVNSVDPNPESTWFIK